MPDTWKVSLPFVSPPTLCLVFSGGEGRQLVIRPGTSCSISVGLNLGEGVARCGSGELLLAGREGVPEALRGHAVPRSYPASCYHSLLNVPSAWCPLSKETSNKVRLTPSLHESAPWEHDLESLAGSQTSSLQSGVQCVLYSVCTRALNPQLLLSSLAANTTILALPREHRR